MTAMTAVHLQRTIPAPPDRVYRAWLDPELLQRWMSPDRFTTSNAEVDERVGGRYRIWHADADGEAGGFEAELLELVPDERIVLRWGFVGPDREADPALDSTLTVTLAPAPGGATELTLVHERLEAIVAVMPGLGEQVEVGWGQALDRLETAAG